MTVQEIFKLLDAGFTAAEIRAMNPADPAPAADPKPAPVKEPAVDPAPAADPKPAPAAEPPADPAPEPPASSSQPAAAGPDPLDAIKQQLQGLTDVVDKMSKAIIMPNMDNVKPLGIEDIITNFFKED